MSSQVPGYATGRTIRTYYNDTGAYSNTTALTEIAKISNEKYTPPKKKFITAETRDSDYELSAEGVAEQPKLTFSYTRAKGVTDAVWTDITNAAAPKAEPLDIFVLNDDATLTGAHGDRFFGKVTFAGEDRDLGKFLSRDVEIQGVTHFANTGNATVLCAPTTFTAS